MRDILGSAAKNAMATIGAGGLLFAVYIAFQAAKHGIGAWEVERRPVLADVSICNGRIDRTSGECDGRIITYAAFLQTGASCDGRDAIVSGTLSKVREDAKYAPGRQVIYYGSPWGLSRRAFWEPMDQPPDVPMNRPTGVQDWGPWRLVGGCVTTYESWFTTVEHTPWHGLWNLVTTSGPFPLPRAPVMASEDDEGRQEKR